METSSPIPKPPSPANRETSSSSTRNAPSGSARPEAAGARSVLRFLAAAWLASSALLQPAPALASLAGSTAGEPPEITAKSAIVIDALTGEPLFEKNADERRPVASTQKLLTALLVAERGDLDAEVVVAEEDTQVEATLLGIQAGEHYPRRDLLKALLIKSGNDVAECLGRDYAGTSQAFAEMMTRRARVLGMADSCFLNPSGLPADGQFSTARDMARLGFIVCRHPVLRDLVQIREFEFTLGDGSVKPLTNTNRLLHSSPVCTGMKTGFTYAAGKCLISSGTLDDRSVIVVVLGSSNRAVWKESRELLHWSLGWTDPEETEENPPSPQPKGKPIQTASLQKRK